MVQHEVIKNFGHKQRYLAIACDQKLVALSVLIPIAKLGGVFDFIRICFWVQVKRLIKRKNRQTHSTDHNLLR